MTVGPLARVEAINVLIVGFNALLELLEVEAKTDAVFVAVQVAVINGVDDPPGVIVIDDMFGIRVVNVTLPDAVSPLDDVTVTVALYEVPCTTLITERDVA